MMLLSCTVYQFAADTYTDNEEIWDESGSGPDSEIEHDHIEKGDIQPDLELPNFSGTNKEQHQNTILSQWVVRNLLIIQVKFHLPDNALNLLIKFLYAYFVILGQFYPALKALVKSFPPMLYAMRKKTGFTNSFQKLVVCKWCLQIYEYSRCVNTLLHSSKHCTYVK